VLWGTEVYVTLVMGTRDLCNPCYGEQRDM